jgi:hypothetical protein
MSIRVVNNRKLEMTDDEWDMYQKIVQSYTDVTGKGEDLFIDLFEANNDGIIVFLKPPSKRRTSLEVFLFLMALMQHQHLRLMHTQIDEAVAEIKKNNKATK